MRGGALGVFRMRSWKTMSWFGSLSGPGGCRTVKAGMVKVAGMLPVVKSRGAEPVPSLKTWRIWYVVFGSMPATRKLVLLPGTTARASVFRHAGRSPATANWTKTVAADEGGTLYRATRGLGVGVTTACAPVPREATSSVTTAEVVSVAA